MIITITTITTNNYNALITQLSQEVKSTRTIRFGYYYNITWETIFWKHSTQDVVNKLVSEPFIENHNWAYLFINSLCYNFVFILS